MNGLDHLESELAVDFGIGGVAAFEVASSIFGIALGGRRKWVDEYLFR